MSPPEGDLQLHHTQQLRSHATKAPMPCKVTKSGEPVYSSKIQDNEYQAYNGQVVISDFNRSASLKPDGDIPFMEAHYTTPEAAAVQYAAPEVMLDGSWSKASDIWSLGVVVGIQQHP